MDMKRDSLRETKIRSDAYKTENLQSTSAHQSFNDVYKIRGTGCVVSVKSKPQTKISDDVMSRLVKVEENDSEKDS